jgi:hypothetical protein
VSADAVEAPTWPIAQTITPKPANCRKSPARKKNRHHLMRATDEGVPQALSGYKPRVTANGSIDQQ